MNLFRGFNLLFLTIQSKQSMNISLKRLTSIRSHSKYTHTSITYIRIGDSEFPTEHIASLKYLPEV